MDLFIFTSGKTAVTLSGVTSLQLEKTRSASFQNKLGSFKTI